MRVLIGLCGTAMTGAAVRTHVEDLRDAAAVAMRLVADRIEADAVDKDGNWDTTPQPRRTFPIGRTPPARNCACSRRPSARHPGKARCAAAETR